MKMSWFYYAIFSSVFLVAMFLLMKMLMNRSMNSTSVAFYQFVFSIIFLGAILFYNSPKDFKVNGFFIAILVVVGLLNALGNFFLFKSISLADNSGYAIAIANLNVVLILFASIFLFGVRLDLLKIIGTLLVITGVILIGLNNH